MYLQRIFEEFCASIGLFIFSRRGFELVVNRRLARD
jgi:hypothetical protein